jgi:ATP-dependent Clp protease adaptor protein ClpS
VIERVHRPDSTARRTAASNAARRARPLANEGAVDVMNGIMISPLDKARWSARPERETETITVPDLAHPWNVVVHDDPVTLMVYVTRVFMKVFGYPHTKAHQLMMEVHTQGRSIVWTGDREQAELYVQQLQSYHLLTTLERVEG